MLRELRKNARLPDKTLAERIGVASSIALERVAACARAERSAAKMGRCPGYARPRPAGDDQRAPGASFTRRPGCIPRLLLILREVLAFQHVAGINDHLLHVAVADSDHLPDFALDAFITRREVAHIETHLIFTFPRNPGLAIYVQEDKT